MDVWSVLGGMTDECMDLRPSILGSSMDVQIDRWTDTGIFFSFSSSSCLRIPRVGISRKQLIKCYSVYQSIYLSLYNSKPSSEFYERKCLHVQARKSSDPVYTGSKIKVN